MAKLYDRVKQTSTSTGTGDFTLSGSVGGFKDFSDVFSVGDETYYCITADDGEFEVGQGTYSAANTFGIPLAVDVHKANVRYILWNFPGLKFGLNISIAIKNP